MQDTGWHFDHSYSRLPDRLFVRVRPEPVDQPAMTIFNRSLAQSLGLQPERLEGDTGVAVFAGNMLPKGSKPIAQAYAGHQFGHFTMLGDGRALLLGEQIAPDHSRHDIQLKGSGPTPFSRRGDGRAALGPMLREYLISEAMHALGVPTTRSLAVVTTGEPVYRESVLQGAVLTRVATSHLRVGTFEYAAALQEPPLLETLTHYTLHRHYPEAEPNGNAAARLLEEILERQARLIAQWLTIGFIHGVMNTDNMALSGETIDYGPCAFMDYFDPATVFSSIDHGGRYAYGKQPEIAHWNLTRFAETLLPLLDEETEPAVERAKEILAKFPDRFEAYWLDGMRAKLGLQTEDPEDASLITKLLQCLKLNRADYTSTFHRLAESCDSTPHTPAFEEWHCTWQTRLDRESVPRTEIRMRMEKANPLHIPRNHRVEEALQAATEGNLTPFQTLLEAVTHPYEDRSEWRTLTAPPPDDGRNYQTFCGT